jgi:hypothetical protein
VASGSPALIVDVVGTPGVDVLVTGVADDQGLAAARNHPRGPFRWVFASLGVEVLESANVVHFHSVD